MPIATDVLDIALRVEGLKKSFGANVAVDDVWFRIAKGETFGLLGPNGAGKTTTISMICGLIAADAGTVDVYGTRIAAGSPRGRRLIGYVPQELAIYPDLSGRDNLRFFGRLYGLRGAEAERRIDEVLDVVALRDRAGDRSEEYSGGMKRRLNIAAGMLHEPRLLILDEPTVGIDPQSRNAILDAVAALGDAGLSVLYTTHYMEEAERLCDRLAIMDGGKIKATGTRRELVSMVGKHDVVNLTVSRAARAAAEGLRALPGVRSATAQDDRTVSVLADGAAALLPDIIGTFAGTPIHVQGVEVLEPSLDAVFLHLTGTALRD